MLAALALMVLAARPLSTEQLLELQRARTEVGRWVNITCAESSCLAWDAARGRWRFARKDVLVTGLPSDIVTDPFRAPWTDRSLATVFPELSPYQLAIRNMGGPAKVLWGELVRWLAEDPARLGRYGPGMWTEFKKALGAHPTAGAHSAWRRPFDFEAMVWLGMTPDALRSSVTVLRCDAVTMALYEDQRFGILTADVLDRLAGDGKLRQDQLLDAWGTRLWLKPLPGGITVAKLGSYGHGTPTLTGWQIVSPGPDREPGTSDDVACGDIRRTYGPPVIEPYGYYQHPRGPWDDQIDAALAGRHRSGEAGLLELLWPRRD